MNSSVHLNHFSTHLKSTDFCSPFRALPGSLSKFCFVWLKRKKKKRYIHEYVVWLPMKHFPLYLHLIKVPVRLSWNKCYSCLALPFISVSVGIDMVSESEEVIMCPEDADFSKAVKVTRYLKSQCKAKKG